MRMLSASEVLNVWELGLYQQLPQRALSLLAAASPDTAPDELAQLPIGERDARLLRLREGMFGTGLSSIATCPGCGQPLDLEFAVDQVRSPIPPEEPRDVLSFTIGAYEVAARLPTTVDVLALAADEDPAVLRRSLLERCIIAVRCGADEQTIDRLPDEVLARVVDALNDADPQANVQLALSCPSCTHRWDAVFDIVSFLWSEIDAWARRLLRDVHALASAYGWRESDVLALSPLRRQLYLEMAAT